MSGSDAKTTGYTDEQIEEIAARAICLDDDPDADWDYIKSVPYHPLFLTNIGHARAVLSALREAGYTIAKASGNG